MSIGGTLITHNCLQYDYCLGASLSSLLAVCDQVSVVDGKSNDGTFEYLQALQESINWNSNTPVGGKYPFLLVQCDWKPSPLGVWLSELTNIARNNLSTDYHVSIQADEVIHEDSFETIKALASQGFCASVARLNFWKDHQHIIPPGQRCGSRVVRLAPLAVPSVGDAENLEPAFKNYDSEVKIFHYGFIRNPILLAAKAIPMQQAFFNHHDPIFDEVIARGANGASALTDPKFPTAVPETGLIPYKGSHPKFAHHWLKEHGYEL